MNYDRLLIEADQENLVVREKPLAGNNGRIYGRHIAIRKDISTIDKACALAEELGHHYTTIGDISDQTKVENRKQELKARIWAYNHQIGLRGIIKAYNYGCRTIHDTADFLDVTEEFLINALKCYREKYGMCATIDNFIIYFEPNLGVMKITDI